MVWLVYEFSFFNLKVMEHKDKIQVQRDKLKVLSHQRTTPTGLKHTMKHHSGIASSILSNDGNSVRSVGPPSTTHSVNRITTQFDQLELNASPVPVSPTRFSPLRSLVLERFQHLEHQKSPPIQIQKFEQTTKEQHIEIKDLQQKLKTHESELNEINLTRTLMNETQMQSNQKIQNLNETIRNLKINEKKLNENIQVLKQQITATTYPMPQSPILKDTTLSKNTTGKDNLYEENKIHELYIQINDQSQQIINLNT